jgi:hypothetical protein
MATGWTAARRSPAASPAAPIRALRKGRTRLPSACLAGHRTGVEAAVAVDEDGALELGEEAEDRPAGNFGLGDEGKRLGDAAEHGDVEPGRMVGRHQHRRGRGIADHRHPHADHAPGQPLPSHRQVGGHLPAAPDRDQLERHDDEGEDTEDEYRLDEADGARHRPALSLGSSGTP